jgi:hypothetical protein
MDQKRFTNDVANPHPWIQRTERILIDHLHAASQWAHLVWFEVSDVVPLELDQATGQGLHPQHSKCGSRFAASTFTHQAKGLAVPQLKGHAVDRFYTSDRSLHEALGQSEMNLKIIDLEKRLFVYRQTHNGYPKQALR